ncbi:MAG: DUF2235 domain-containing protein [Pseudomonadota bacterium]
MAKKRIAVLCDGTWNRPDAENPTNVMQMARAVRRSDDDGTVQQVIYVTGVGTGRGPTPLARKIDQYIGGAFGIGLLRNIEEAYWHLAFNYVPGDEIYIFGFSRGAFTARSLAGLIRSCGIPPEDQIRRLPEAMRLYQMRGSAFKPDSERSLKFRQAFSPFVATSAMDVERRKADGLGACELINISYLGVWDTVGALGIPQWLSISRLFSQKYKFHDLALSRSVASARHAIAVDERRKSYQPTLWANLEGLNGDLGANGPYQQHWFPGDHSAIGGGGPIRDLSAITLRWIAEGAQAAGLAVNEALLANLTGGATPLGPLTAKDKPPSFFGRLSGGPTGPRQGPSDPNDLSEAAQTRLSADLDYRPETLKPFWPSFRP